MEPEDRGLAERVHVAVTSAAPNLMPKTWYGMPAYAEGRAPRAISSAGFHRTSLLDPPPLTGLSPAGVVEGVHELLDNLGPASSVSGLPRGEYAGLVRECARARARLQALELRLVESHRQTKLAQALDTDALAGTADALGAGAVSAAHAAVIAAAIRQLPPGLPVAEVARIEADLLAKAKRMDPKALRTAARRALAAVERDQAVVDAHEDTVLRDEEETARTRLRASIHDHGDGTATVTARTTTLAAGILKKVLDQLASPRRARLGATVVQAGEVGNPNSADFDWARRRGEAFTTLLERLPA